MEKKEQAESVALGSGFYPFYMYISDKITVNTFKICTFDFIKMTNIYRMCTL